PTSPCSRSEDWWRAAGADTWPVASWWFRDTHRGRECVPRKTQRCREPAGKSESAPCSAANRKLLHVPPPWTHRRWGNRLHPPDGKPDPDLDWQQSGREGALA